MKGYGVGNAQYGNTVAEVWENKVETRFQECLRCQAKVFKLYSAKFIKQKHGRASLGRIGLAVVWRWMWKKNLKTGCLLQPVYTKVEGDEQ